MAASTRIIDVIHYHGSGYVECYAYRIFEWSDQLRLKIDNLLAQNLSWTWLSESRLVSPEQSMPNFSRRLTVLSEANSDLLVKDFEFRDVDGYGMFVALFGCRNGILLTDTAQLRRELNCFCNGRITELDVAVIRPADDPVDYVFFRSNSANIAAALLEAEISHGSSVKFIERPYRRLRTASLESLFLEPAEKHT